MKARLRLGPGLDFQPSQQQNIVFGDAQIGMFQLALRWLRS